MRQALMLLGALAMTGALTETLADDYPDGCVSCHVQAETDSRLNTLLSNIGHGRGGERTKEIPIGCNRCHAPDGSGNAPSIRKLVHSIHYEAAEQNRFVTQYGGDCRSCHSLDSATGDVGIKTGERNWTFSVLHPEEEAAAPAE